MNVKIYKREIPCFTNLNISKHLGETRNERMKNVNKIGKGTIMKSFLVDKNHPNGLEIHIITSTGLIFIFNERTGKLCTILIARPAQIKRYYENCNIPNEIPRNVVELAYQHECNNLNK